MDHVHVFLMQQYFRKITQRGISALVDKDLRRVFSNALRLIGGNAAQAIFGMFSVFIVARALGVDRFGQLVLVSSWSLIILQLFSFQTSYALVKEGSVSAAKNDYSALWSVIRFGLILDVATAALAVIIFALGTLVISHSVELDPIVILLAYLYTLTMATSIVGTPTAVLRLFGQYDAFVLHGSASGLCKLAFTGIAWVCGGGLLHFGVAWIAAQVVANVMLCVLSMREYRKQLRQHPLREPISTVREVMTKFPEIRSRLISTNLSATLRMVRDLDVPILGLLLNPAAVGLFKIARQIGAAFMKIIDPIFQAIYPDMAEIEERSGWRAVALLLRKSSLVVGSCGLLAVGAFAVLGKPALEIGLGVDFVDSFPAAMFCVVGAAIWGFSQSYGAALLVWSRHRALLVLNIFASVIYLGSLVLLTLLWGVTGAGLSTTIYFILWSAVAMLIVRRELEQRKILSNQVG